MKEIPILFSTPMVQAILAGNKTMTRRVVKPQPTMYKFGDHESLAWQKPMLIPGYDAVGVEHVIACPDYLRCPYGKPGDRLWVRETWLEVECEKCRAGMPALGGECKCTYMYKADNKHIQLDKLIGSSFFKWKPSIHMPKVAARIWLEVVSVRVERLQDITEAACYKEGIKYESVLEFRNRTGKGTDHIAKADFKNLWDSINAKRGFGWDVNPYVWVVEFKRLEVA